MGGALSLAEDATRLVNATLLKYGESQLLKKHTERGNLALYEVRKQWPYDNYMKTRYRVDLATRKVVLCPTSYEIAVTRVIIEESVRLLSEVSIAIHVRDEDGASIGPAEGQGAARAPLAQPAKAIIEKELIGTAPVAHKHIDVCAPHNNT